MDLTALQTKINNYITVVSSWVRNVGKIYFDSTPADVTVQLIDENGNVVDSTVPNRAKLVNDFEIFKSEVGLKNNGGVIEDLSGNVVGGKVLQLVNVLHTDTSSGNGTWKCFEARITPTRVNSKILIMVQASLVVDQSNDGYAKVQRDGADLALGTGAGDVKAQMFISGYNGWGGTTTNLIYLDNPATTSEVVYELFAMSDTGANAPIYLNKRKEDSGGDTGTAISTITLMEIGV